MWAGFSYRGILMKSFKHHSKEIVATWLDSELDPVAPAGVKVKPCLVITSVSECTHI